MANSKGLAIVNTWLLLAHMMLHRQMCYEINDDAEKLTMCLGPSWIELTM